MRDSFWYLLYSLKFKEHYLDGYCVHVARLDNLLSAVTLLASAGCIAAWSVWSSVPWLWSLLIMAAQVLQIVRPLLPYSRRICAFRYLIPELRRLTLEIEIAWLRAEHETPAPGYISQIRDFRSSYLELESKYLGVDILPDKRQIRAVAEKKTETYLQLFLCACAEQGDDVHAQADQPDNSDSQSPSCA